jgi:hypothetical protein
MKLIKAVWASWMLSTAATVFLAGHAAGCYWPAAWWVTHGEVFVAPLTVGEPVVIRTDRKVHRSHRADWSVSLHKQGLGGKNWGVVCTGRGSSLYTPENELPVPLTLAWWAGEHCQVSAPGLYRIDTSWDLQVWPLPKRVTVTSNVFSVADQK